MVDRLLLAAWLVQASVPADAQQRNPFETDEAAIGIGASLFATRCADCHGPDAKGNRGPDLTQHWARGATDESAFEAIRAGVPGSIMPPSTAPDNEIWAIVAHLRRISVMPPLKSTGDARRGREIFVKDCAECHQAHESGAALGPDLTSVGATRSRAALIVALREPSASVALGFRAVAVVPRRGDRVEGIVKSEDAFSIQLVSLDGALRAFAKDDVREIVRHAESPMPAFGVDRLPDAALEDLLAYLGTLRGAASASIP